MHFENPILHTFNTCIRSLNQQITAEACISINKCIPLYLLANVHRRLMPLGGKPNVLFAKSNHKQLHSHCCSIIDHQ